MNAEPTFQVGDRVEHSGEFAGAYKVVKVERSVIVIESLAFPGLQIMTGKQNSYLTRVEPIATGS